MKEIIQPDRNIVSSGITNNNKPAVHLLEYRGWIKKDNITRPVQDGSNVVMGRLCCGSFMEAVGLVTERMKDLCEKNGVPEDSYEISFIAIKEMDLPIV